MATPAFVKRITRSDTVLSLGVNFSKIYFKFVMWTGRYDRQAAPIPEPYILAMWHGRLIMAPMLQTKSKPLVALISGHRDGKIISRVGAAFGIQTAVGSSSRGGMRAAREMMRLGKSGHSLFVTPDGPRGPRMRINSEGVLDMARLTGLPILPVSVSLSRHKLLRSWDRLMLPGLFAKVAIRFGEPITVEAGSPTAEIAERLQAALTAAQNETDRIVGLQPVEAA
ncbi:lysophospholipid acyltransferase family protein [Rhodopseudomonas palustris]|uniref:lysophospholipid acyltransferase family protein n=1 Tax=Rhodopseudomonas palustris TaxID=1076 RepID=UPI0021F35552|nr:lysophospholipid acyltransferase family protein [Rhodopseudomonas palustris]UYO44517.1 lysophospholipid acyltransferase family protein [Rhodopseudomonas palustris]